MRPPDDNQLKLICMNSLLASRVEQVYFKDRLSRFLFVSAGMAAACAPGKTPAQLVGLTDFDLFSYEHAAAARADEQQIMRTGVPIVGKLEKETYRDGVERWVSTTRLPLKDERGRILGTFGISRDITDQIKTAQIRAARR